MYSLLQQVRVRSQLGKGTVLTYIFETKSTIDFVRPYYFALKDSKVALTGVIQSISKAM